MKRITILFVCAALLSLLFSCGESDTGDLDSDDSGEPAFEWTEANFPRIDGSTATIPLGQAVAATLLGKTRAECEKYTEFSGTTTAYKKLASGETDLLIVYEGAASTLAELGDIFDMTPIGRDALVFLVNQVNPVNNLTTKQLQDIYTGAVTNWNEVGGNDILIRAFQRNETSGSQTMMTKLVTAGLPLTEASTDLVIGGMGDLVDVIASYDNGESAIGYNVYYYVSEMKLDDNIKLLSVDGVEPTPDSIGSGEYPFVNDFFVVIRKDAAEGSPERELYEWMCGKDAKDLMVSENYVPIK